jgi:Ca2+-binding EF-hand superfamily protein
MTPKLLSTTVIAGVALAGAALAQNGPERLCTRGFLEADVNADDAISMEESSAAAQVEFSTIDTNGDGMISQEEYLKCAGKWAESAASASVAASNAEALERTEMTDIEYTYVDRDGDGTVTQEEFMTWMENTHRAATDPANVETASASGSEAVGSEAAENGSSGTMDMDRDPALVLRRIVLIPFAPDDDPSAMNRDEMSARAAQQFIYRDTNADRQLSPDEWSGTPDGTDHVSAVLSQRFDRMDADSSGDVTREEFIAEARRTLEGAQARAGQTGCDEAVGPPVVYYRYPHPM